jgi:isoquinoline 1-oxidoreductase subunit beta
MKTEVINTSRRDFLKTSAVLGGGLVLATMGLPATAYPSTGAFEPNIWVAVDKDGLVKVTFAWNELGQGAMTSLAMCAADELDVAWDTVSVHIPVWESKYGNNITGGSSSMRRSWDPLRKAAAAGREMLRQAAAQAWKVEPGSCRTADGRVSHPPTGRSLGYGELVEKAAALDVPENPTLKTPDQRTIVGTRIARRDGPAKVTGQAKFCGDLRRDDLLVAAARRCPVPGGTVASFDDGPARAVKGVSDVVAFDDWVAVLANDTWAAFQGRDALTVTWDFGAGADFDDEKLHTILQNGAAEDGYAVREAGDPEAAIAAAAKVIEADYRFPFIAHCAMEPSVCIALVKGDVCEVECPTQAPVLVARDVSQALRIPFPNVHVTSTYVGSAFGRRLMADYAVEAALLSRHTGRPVKIQWTREDELQHDFYRPASLHRQTAGLDSEGRLTVWTQKVSAPSIGQQLNPTAPKGADPAVLAGIENTLYKVPSHRFSHVPVSTPTPLGWWRSVYDHQNAFANECFLDEAALAAGKDPIEQRLELLLDDKRLKRVVEMVRDRSGWPRPSQPGRSLGFAAHACFKSFGAQVAEVSVADNGRLSVHRVVSVIDCGPAVNPDAIRSQMEGGVAMGLGVALRESISIREGAVVQDNFDSYRPLRLDEMPSVETHIVDSDDEIGGIGEPVLPPTAPAVCNAIFAACGVRIRHLPIGSQLRGAQR